MTLFLLLLLAQVNPHLRLVSTKIYAPNQTIKPILIMVTVQNDAQVPLVGGIVNVKLTPLIHPGQRGYAPGAAREQSPTMFEPWDLQAPLPALAPGQKQSIILETPFLARGAFSTSGQTFTVENLVPGLKRTVPIHVDVQLTAPNPES